MPCGNNNSNGFRRRCNGFNIENISTNVVPSDYLKSVYERSARCSSMNPSAALGDMIDNLCETGDFPLNSGNCIPCSLNGTLQNTNTQNINMQTLSARNANIQNTANQAGTTAGANCCANKNNTQNGTNNAAAQNFTLNSTAANPSYIASNNAVLPAANNLPTAYLYNDTGICVNCGESVPFENKEIFANNVNPFSFEGNGVKINCPGIYEVEYQIKPTSGHTAFAVYYNGNEVAGSRFSNGFFESAVYGKVFLTVPPEALNGVVTLVNVTSASIRTSNKNNAGVSSLLTVSKI